LCFITILKMNKYAMNAEIVGHQSGNPADTDNATSTLADQHAMLVRLQRDSFAYFVHEVNPRNGLVKDKTADNWPASIAAVGMALTVYPIGVERGFMTRAHALKLTLATLRFFATSEQGTGPHASGHQGFYYHFLDMDTGRRAWDCELSSIDTALLMAGVLLAAAYFDGAGSDETEVRSLADVLYRRVNWAWMCDPDQLICHGWTPESGFLPFHWAGYDEALILYLLALGSPTHGITPGSYAAWTRSYEWKTVYGIAYLYAGPLFIHQMSHLWVDFRGLQDRFMREHDSDYFENSRRATLVQQGYAIENPQGYAQYGQFSWGVTASDGPGCGQRMVDGVSRSFFDYVARGAPFGPDDGTLAPWAVVACLPFAPEIVLPTIAQFQQRRLCEANPYGFKASFNPSFHTAGGGKAGWVSPYHFGINEGPTVIMIANYLDDFPWRLMRNCPYLLTGLRKAGFHGGWLDASTQAMAE
jgi:hypothetical protein